jgi:mRNA interferase RelE/StbE
MKLEYDHDFVQALFALDRSVAKQIREKLQALSRAEDHQHLALRGRLAGRYKLRVGDYRLIYVIRDGTLFFLELGHRSSVYE